MTTQERLAALKASHAAELKTDTDRQKAEIKALQMEVLLTSTETVDQTVKVLGLAGTTGLPLIMEAFTTLKTQNATLTAQNAALTAQVAELNAQLNP